MQNIKCCILSTREVNKDNKVYYIVKLWLDFSDLIITVFVSKSIYNDILNKIIDNDNLLNYLHFRVDSSGKFSVSIN